MKKLKYLSVIILLGCLSVFINASPCISLTEASAQKDKPSLPAMILTFCFDKNIKEGTVVNLLVKDAQKKNIVAHVYHYIQKENGECIKMKCAIDNTGFQPGIDPKTNLPNFKFYAILESKGLHDLKAQAYKLVYLNDTSYTVFSNMKELEDADTVIVESFNQPMQTIPTDSISKVPADSIAKALTGAMSIRKLKPKKYVLPDTGKYSQFINKSMEIERFDSKKKNQSTGNSSNKAWHTKLKNNGSKQVNEATDMNILQFEIQNK